MSPTDGAWVALLKVRDRIEPEFEPVVEVLFAVTPDQQRNATRQLSMTSRQRGRGYFSLSAYPTLKCSARFRLKSFSRRTGGQHGYASIDAPTLDWHSSGHRSGFVERGNHACCRSSSERDSSIQSWWLSVHCAGVYRVPAPHVRRSHFARASPTTSPLCSRKPRNPSQKMTARTRRAPDTLTRRRDRIAGIHGLSIDTIELYPRNMIDELAPRLVHGELPVGN
jgi:hypothetical protein